jgi:hypothetical protein
MQLYYELPNSVMMMPIRHEGWLPIIQQYEALQRLCYDITMPDFFQETHYYLSPIWHLTVTLYNAISIFFVLK